MTHGGLQPDELARVGLDIDNVLDVSANLNPYGPPPAMLDAIRAVALERYPDPASSRARLSLATFLHVSAESVILGNGASELLWTLVATYALSSNSSRQAVLCTPAFGEIETACQAFGIKAHRIYTNDMSQFAPDLDGLATAASRYSAAFIYICNPGTPTGSSTEHEALFTFASELSSIPIILDESFLSLSDRWNDAHRSLPPNVVRVRSLTKEFAVPGIRIGYAVASPNTCRRMSLQRPAWSVSAAAQAVAEYAPHAQSFVDDSRCLLKQDRASLVNSLRALGLRPLPSIAPYIAFPCDNAAQLRERLLLHHGIGVRDCASFGLNNFIRVAVRPEADRTQLLRALDAEVTCAGLSDNVVRDASSSISQPR